MLYNVKVEIDMLVLANNDKEAIEVAKKNAPNEISIYGQGKASQVKEISDVPEDWKSVIPYSMEGVQETRKCYEFFNNTTTVKKELEKDEIEQIIRIKEGSHGKSIVEEIKPENKIDPKPRELDWHDTKSGRPLPKLRFL
jgi:hypothetical protein